MPSYMEVPVAQMCLQLRLWYVNLQKEVTG